MVILHHANIGDTIKCLFLIDIMALCSILLVLIIVLLIVIIICCCTRKDKQKETFSFASELIFPHMNSNQLHEYDKKVFKSQLTHINNYKRHPVFDNIRNAKIIIGDVHGSLVSAFAPLINAGILKENSIMFDYRNRKFGYKFSNNANNNVVIYCGDILDRGANTYSLQLFECILDISEKRNDCVKFVFGNHDIWFMLNKQPKDTEDENRIRNKAINFFMKHPSSIAYVFNSGGKSFIVSHTYLTDSAINNDGIMYPTGNDFYDIYNNENILSEVQKHSGNLYFKDCFNGDDLVCEQVHNKLKNSLNDKSLNKNTIDWIFNSIFYITRPYLNDNGTISIPQHQLIKYETNNDNVQWFIGHTQIQNYDESKRHISKDGIVIHFMDTNTLNYTGIDYDSLPEKLKQQIKNKYAYNYLYYAVVNDYGKVSFIEEIDNDNEVSETIMEFNQIILTS